MQEGLVSVPTQFFQSSLALGSLIQVRQDTFAIASAEHLHLPRPC